MTAAASQPPDAQSGDDTSLDFTAFAPPSAAPAPAAPVVKPAPVATPKPSLELVPIPAAGSAPMEANPATPVPVPSKAAAPAPAAPKTAAPPPQSQSASTAPEAAAGIKTATLAGTLNARVQEPLKQIAALALKMPVRLDLSRLTDVDEAGCTLLLGALLALRRAKGALVVAGAAHLADLLATKAVTGQRQHDKAWLLLLEIQQRLGRQEVFEDTAVNYAVTFEVSPPSWDIALVGQCEP